jgi:hypothetical protein
LSGEVGRFYGVALESSANPLAFRVSLIVHPPMKLASCLLLAMGLSVVAADPPSKLMPVDEATKDPSFFVFRARLLEVIARHDGDALLKTLDPNIQTSFGGNGGIQEFKEMWKPETPDSELWTALAGVLSMGGKFGDASEFSAPYVAAAWPENLDPFDHGAITAENVRVRAKPDASGEVIGSLSFAIVRVLEWTDGSETAAWIKVQLTDGREGYVARDYVGSAAGQRAYFSKRDGVWKMTAFVAGD